MAAENNIVGEVGLLVKPIDPNAQFQRGVDEMIKRLEKQAQFQVKAAGLDQAQEAANSLSSSFAQAAIQAGAVTAAVYGIRAAVQGTLGKFQGLFDQLRQAQAGFASILKSDAAGGALLSQIQEFARVSPFVTQELVNYSQQLLGVGVSAGKIVPLLEDVGNIVSSVGGDTQNIGRVLFTLTQIQSIGRLAGQDAMQLQSALIPITKYLSEYLNKTTAEVKKLQEQGAISAETVFAAISAQGEKVQGAMANATRNIGGARAVLSDTIQIMLQNQPVLNKINDEIFKAILKLSESLSSPEFTQGFSRFFDSIDNVYESLRPLIEELVKLGGSSVITGMGQTASFLGILGDVLSVLPEPVMEALARLLVAMATLKAPLMLIQYVQNIKTMSAALVPAVSNLSKLGTVAQANVAPLNAEAAAIEKTTQALTRTQAIRQRLTGTQGNTLAMRAGQAVGRNSTGLAIGAALGGGYLAGSDNANAAAAGSALTLGATGFMLAGPAGGVAGAALGAITSYMNAAEAEARRHVEEMKTLGAEAANSFIEEEGKKFDEGSSAGEIQKNYDRQRADIEARLRAARAVVDATEQNGVAGIGDKIGGATLGRLGLYDDSDLKDAQAAAAVLAGVNEELKVLEDAATTAFEPATIGIKNIVEGLDRTQPAFDALTMHTGHAGRVATTSIAQAEEAFKKYGIAIDEVADPANWDRITAIISAFDGLTTAQQNATKAANEFNAAYKDALTAAGAIFDPAITELSTKIGLLNQLRAAYDANVAAGKSTDPLTDLAGDKAAQEARKGAYAMSMANSAAGIASAGAGLRKDQRDAAQATARSVAVTKAAEAGERAYATAIKARGDTERIVAQASAPIRKDTVDDLIRMAQVADELDNRTIIVELITANIEARIEQLLEYQRIAADIENGIYKPGGSRAGTLDPTKGIGEGGSGASARTQREIDLLSGKIAPVSKYDQSVIAGNVTDPAAKKIWDLGKAERDREAAEAERIAEEAARRAQQWADAIESSTTSLSESIEQAAQSIKDAADRWIGSIKERTQYEQAVSTGRLIRNTQRQIGDLNELSTGMNALRARGVTQEVLNALGIDNVADVKQVRKLVRSSDEDLARLTGLVGTLNSDAVALATAEEDNRTRKNIEEGIIAAATALGYTRTEANAAVAQILPQFNITTASSPEEVAMAIIGLLTAGRTGLP